MEAEFSEVTSHGLHPLALSPDVLAHGCLFTCSRPNPASTQKVRFKLGTFLLEIGFMEFIKLVFAKVRKV